MSLITASELGKSFGPNDVFSGVSLSIPQRARIGLVGPNGVGKTTLLEVLAGLEEPSNGNVQRARGLQVGYLPQEAEVSSTRTLWDECLEAFSGLILRQKRLEELEIQMGDANRAQEILGPYGRLQEEFERLGGYTYENRIRQTLTGLGFSEKDAERPMTQLSGGQRTRALLAKLLLENPDLLLLDEPTNHLDINAIEWLEAYLRDWEGAVVSVSHDRYYLDQVVDSILEMSEGLVTFSGNYSAYAQQRVERDQRKLDEYKAQQVFIQKEEAFIRRYIAGQKTRQAQGRRKRLERLLEEDQKAPPSSQHHMHLDLKPVSRSGDLVLRTRALSVGYEDEGVPLFAVPDLVLKRSECAAIIGPNGAGKTTFLKTLLEQIPPLDGEVILGASLKIGYFAQAHEDLHLDWTLMEEIQAKSPGMLPADVRNYLARFLFTGDDVFKMVRVLSGGERGRLALACLALGDANLLLLDEPTNHLDLTSQEVLEGILTEFAGTVLLVSHDRYLVDALATQIWDVQPEGRKLLVYNGSYSEYRAAREAEAARLADERVETSRKKSSGSVGKDITRDARRRSERKQNLEGDIAELEEQMADLSRELENPPEDLAQVETLGQEYVRLQQALDTCLEEYLQL
jgi:ATP-binding cassette, subfamily F, member 3